MLTVYVIYASFVLASAITLREDVGRRRKHKESKKKDEQKRPNIVWILADDLHYEIDEFAHFPHLKKLKSESIEFTNHVTQSPLCGPARASLIVGRYPHNSGYLNQDHPGTKFRQLQDQSVGAWLTKSGYYTAYLGKYINGIGGTVGVGNGDDVPTGWRHFGGFTREWDQFKQLPLAGAYTYYNASQWLLDYDETGTKRVVNSDSKYPIKIWTGVHQADFLATQTTQHASIAIDMKKPFFIFTNPVMVHHGTCEGPFPDLSFYSLDDPRLEIEQHIQLSPCAKKDRPSQFMQSMFGDWTLHNPTASYLKPGTGIKPMGVRPLPDQPNYVEDLERMSMGRRNRTASLLDLDDMVGEILIGLEVLRVLDNTYLIFTSDNGFHMGEHAHFYGKELPYEYDLRVPMLVRTPQGTAGLSKLPTTHVDITRTIVDIANAEQAVTPSLAELDGLSFFDALSGDLSVDNWRRFSYSELFERDNKTWRNIRFLGDDGELEWTLHFWCTGEVELYNMTNNHDQMLNILHPAAGKDMNAYAEGILDKWMPVVIGLGSCIGAACSDSKMVRKTKGLDDWSTILPCSTFDRLTVITQP